MKLSVIIPAYNHLDMVMRCYRSIVATTDPTQTEVLVQDDSSTEYNGELLFRPGVCQRNDMNYGFGGNCNRGAQRAKGDVLLFLNQDVVVHQPDWDSTLLRFFEDHPQAAIVGPTLLFPNGHVQSVGGAFDAASQPFHVALGYANPDYDPINISRQVGWVTGAALAVRHGDWLHLSGFDPIYGRGYFEDVDLCVRAQRANLQIWHCPQVRMIHEVGSTGGNPQFAKNAREFKRRFVDTGEIKPDVSYLKVRFWA